MWDSQSINALIIQAARDEQQASGEFSARIHDGLLK
jgi:hypothetical protein